MPKHTKTQKGEWVQENRKDPSLAGR